MNGVWHGPMSSPVSFITKEDYTYTDKNNRSVYMSDDNGNWGIAFKNDGQLTFLKNPGPIDIFLVGAGAAGQSGYGNYSQGNGTAYGGAGGAGGETKTEYKKNVRKNQNYTIIIANPSSSSPVYNTQFNNEFIAYGNLSNETTSYKKGGKGAYSGWVSGGDDAPTAGSSDGPQVGTSAFNGIGVLFGDETLYGAGGGGGNASRRSGGYWYNNYAALGASTGGGRGAYKGSDQPEGYTPPSAGQANTGSGGGGGFAYCDKDNYGIAIGSGAIGGSGIIIIRNHRDSIPSS